MIQKLHVNTGHASVPQMLRLAQRAKAPAGLVAEIRKFKCPICEELQVPPSHRVAALHHTETPNHIVGLDVVQVELKKDGPHGTSEQKFNVLTAVDYATDFAQQIVLPSGSGVVSRAFHALWCRPYGPPRVVYVDPDQRWMVNFRIFFGRTPSHCLTAPLNPTGSWAGSKLPSVCFATWHNGSGRLLSALPKKSSRAVAALGTSS